VSRKPACQVCLTCEKDTKKKKRKRRKKKQKVLLNPADGPSRAESGAFYFLTQRDTLLYEYRHESHTHTRARTHTHADARTRTHTHTHTHTHAQYFHTLYIYKLLSLQIHLLYT